MEKTIVATPLLPTDRLEPIDGWGMAVQSMGYVYRPSTIDGIREVFRLAQNHRRPVVLRGSGRSYGDAALKGEAIVLDLTRFCRILAWDPQTGIVTAEAGLTLGDLWQYVVGDGWWPPVVSGTMHPTLGGAAGANIHGKNNYRMGPIGEHILAFDLLTPAGDILRCSRDENADVFHAAIGGFGMLGCFLHITLQLKKVYSGDLEVRPISCASLREIMTVMARRAPETDYIVGWVDCFAKGEALGRGIIHEADYLHEGDDPVPAQTLRLEHQSLPDTFLGFLPKSMLWMGLKVWLHDLGMRFVNWAKYVAGRIQTKPYRQSHAGYHFLLDYVPNWKRAYLPGGLIQYQSFVPKEKALEVFTYQIETARRWKLPAYLGVLKRHRPDPFLLSHAVDGFSFALDFRVTRRNRERLWQLAADLNRAVVAAGGRFYLAKDATLDAQSFQASLSAESFERFRALKDRLDPEGILQSAAMKRLGLI